MAEHTMTKSHLFKLKTLGGNLNQAHRMWLRSLRQTHRAAAQLAQALAEDLKVLQPYPEAMLLTEVIESVPNSDAIDLQMLELHQLKGWIHPDGQSEPQPLCPSDALAGQVLSELRLDEMTLARLRRISGILVAHRYKNPRPVNLAAITRGTPIERIEDL